MESTPRLIIPPCHKRFFEKTAPGRHPTGLGMPDRTLNATGLNPHLRDIRRQPAPPVRHVVTEIRFLPDVERGLPLINPVQPCVVPGCSRQSDPTPPLIKQLSPKGTLLNRLPRQRPGLGQRTLIRRRNRRIDPNRNRFLPYLRFKALNRRPDTPGNQLRKMVLGKHSMSTSNLSHFLQAFSARPGSLSDLNSLCLCNLGIQRGMMAAPADKLPAGLVGRLPGTGLERACRVGCLRRRRWSEEGGGCRESSRTEWFPQTQKEGS